MRLSHVAASERAEMPGQDAQQHLQVDDTRRDDAEHDRRPLLPETAEQRPPHEAHDRQAHQQAEHQLGAPGMHHRPRRAALGHPQHAHEPLHHHRAQRHTRVDADAYRDHAPPGRNQPEDGHAQHGGPDDHAQQPVAVLHTLPRRQVGLRGRDQRRPHGGGRIGLAADRHLAQPVSAGA